MTRLWMLSVLAAILSSPIVRSLADAPPVDYSRDIRPIFTNSCYACHGPDENQRKGKLRLDVRADAIKKAIAPGKSADSLLLHHITSKDADEVMPPRHRRSRRSRPSRPDSLHAGSTRGEIRSALGKLQSSRPIPKCRRPATSRGRTTRSTPSSRPVTKNTSFPRRRKPIRSP